MVSERAGLVVIADTAFEADGFGDRDLHVIDMRGVPQGLVKRVGEPERHQVLHCLLAEVVVDAEDLLFLEHLADRVVEDLRRFEIAADRLFDDDACRFGDQLVIADLVGDVAEDGRGNREIEGADDVLAAVEHGLELVPALVRLGIDRDVKDARQELRDLCLFQFLGFQMLFQRRKGELPVFVVGHRRTRGADDAGRLGQLAGKLAVVERRQELAFRKVAGASEHDIVKRLDGDDLAAHSGFSQSKTLDPHVI